MTNESYEAQGPVIRDRRRIDPETGQVREPRESAAPTPADPSLEPDTAGSPVPGPSDVEVTLAERTADLQRLQAEYINYKRRVDRDRQATRESTIASVLTSLLPVLDDIGRARDHDELTGGFKAVAESLERTVTALGLATFGEVGDEFDPRIHEALMHTYSDDVDGPVCQTVLQVGYRLGDRIVRPARVAVAEPAEVAEVPLDVADQPAATASDGGEAAEAVSAAYDESAAAREASATYAEADTGRDEVLTPDGNTSSNHVSNSDEINNDEINNDSQHS
ncbi:MAG: nucleotide exchange factor GrpE [Propionibacteriales bacterium]|nr:nucleotide exchange factor GrpE [Propionibacteriales bacterium]